MVSRDAALRAAHWVRGGLRRASTVIGAVVLTGGAASAYVSHAARKKALHLPDEFILELDLQDAQLVETELNPFARLGRGGPRQLVVRDVVKALHEAGSDKRVSGLLAVLPDSVGGSVGGMAQVQEVRSAVSHFRLLSCSRGAACVAYADAYGGMASVYLSSAFQHAYMQPSGLVAATGIASQVPFVRGLLDKWRIAPLVHKREQYKNAADPITERSFSAPYREATASLVQSLAGQMVEGIAMGRGLRGSAVRAAVDAAPLGAREAVDAGLLDGLLYRDEVDTLVTEAEGRRSHAPLKRIPLKRYLAALKMKEAAAGAKAGPAVSKAPDKEGEATGEDEENKVSAAEPGAVGRWYAHWREQGLGAWWEATLAAWAGDREAWEFPVLPAPVPRGSVALLYASGPITQGKASGAGGMQSAITAPDICKELEKLRHDPGTRAVVLRVDSPGGSAIASDTIHREVQQLRAAGKTVVVSMGNVAASGGYFIACAADRIVAQPGTLTGSIGVIMLKLNAAGLLEDLGINVQTVKVGKNADMLSPTSGYTPAQDKLLNKLVDGIYDDFVAKVAAGRGLSPAEARRLAKGRVYTGADAKNARLVDDLGGLEDAVRIAKELSGLPEEAQVNVVGKLTRAEAFRKLLGGDSVAVAELSGGIVQAACSLLLRGLAEALLGRATAQWAEQAHAGSASPQAISAGPDIQL